MTTHMLPLLAGGLVALGWFGIVAAQQQGPARIDANEVADELGLTAEVQRQVEPELDRLNELMAQRAELNQRSAGLWNEFADARAKIAAALTPKQWRRFEYVLERAWQSQRSGWRDSMRGMMGRMGHMGGSRGPGMMGDGQWMWGPDGGCDMNGRDADGRTHMRRHGRYSPQPGTGSPLPPADETAAGEEARDHEAIGAAEVPTDPETISLGRSVVAQIGCQSCHVIGSGGERMGPSLNGVVGQRGADFVRRKVADPTLGNTARSRMPNFGLSMEQIETVVAFLATLDGK